LITGALLLLAGAFWLWLAPPKIGGRSTYVITSGISMEPSFRTGDLAIVRPASHYRVGEVVAYHSTLLHVMVLHRIIAVHGGRYTFKGDHNHFIDPTHPTRTELVGALWIHVPGGGAIFSWLHSPVVAAVLCGFVALLFVGTGETKRRRRRRGNRGHGPARQGALPMTPLAPGASLGVSLRSLLAGCAVVAALCAAAGLYAVSRPGAKSVTHRIRYTQKGTVTYHATAPAGAVYPDGTVSTGDPIFLTLVHRLAVKVGYRFATDAAHQLRGTQQVFLQLTGPTGWSRTIPLSPVRHFTGSAIATPASIDLRGLQSLLTEVQKSTGISAEGATVGIATKVHVTGTIAGQPLDATFTPTANFELQPLELTPGGSAPAPSAAAGATAGAAPSTQSGFDPSASGTVTTVASAPNSLTLAGHTFSYDEIKWLALLGFLVTGAAAGFLAVLLRRNQAFDEAVRIRSRYGHLLVPVLSGEDLGWPPVDVTSFKALARLAESTGQLVLHHQADAVDTYMVNDNGTVYRYQISLPLVSWGEWSEANVAADPGALAEAAAVLADAAEHSADAAVSASAHSADATV
jgi:signal peptidase I